MKAIRASYPYPYMPIERRRAILPLHNVCSIAPAVDHSDDLYSGSGSYRIDVSGVPYDDEISVTQEACYEPQWAKTPLPPDLRPYMAEIRRHVLDGEPEKADSLIDKAQIEAGMDKYMNFDAKILYPVGSPHVHKAYWLRIRQEKGEVKDYLRWVDLYSGVITTHWEGEGGVFENEYLAVCGDDLIAIRLRAPSGSLTADIDLTLPPRDGGLDAQAGKDAGAVHARLGLQSRIRQKGLCLRAALHPAGRDSFRHGKRPACGEGGQPCDPLQGRILL